MLSANVAGEWNADIIYICDGSAEETIAFYFAIGCKEAEEINKEVYESDKRDFQLEFMLAVQKIHHLKQLLQIWR